MQLGLQAKAQHSKLMPWWVPNSSPPKSPSCSGHPRITHFSIFVCFSDSSNSVAEVFLSHWNVIEQGPGQSLSPVMIHSALCPQLLAPLQSTEVCVLSTLQSRGSDACRELGGRAVAQALRSEKPQCHLGTRVPWGESPSRAWELGWSPLVISPLPHPQYWRLNSGFFHWAKSPALFLSLVLYYF